MKHWTETDFQHWLYGLKDADRHLDECLRCRSESERLSAERRRIIAEPEVPHEFLAAQRRGVYRRLEERPRNVMAWRWVLSTAMLLVMVIGFTVSRMHNQSPGISDEQLFSELAAMEQRAEPKAIQPMHSLFEE